LAEPYGAIFDMDGVLIDSFEAHYESWKRVAETHGLPLSRADFARTFGRTSREIIQTLWPEIGCDEARVQAIDDEKEAFFREIIADRLPEMPGARELLASLRREGWKIAIGSSGPPENVRLVVRAYGAEFFDAVVTGMDVQRGKPEPDVFLLASERTGVEPRRCVVLEDAPAGIEAAHRAGMVAVGVASTGRSREQLAAAELVVESLAELTPALLRQLVLSRRQ